MPTSVAPRSVVDGAGVQQSSSTETTLLAIKLRRDQAAIISRLCAGLGLNYSDLIRCGLCSLLSRIVDELEPEVQADVEAAIRELLNAGPRPGERRRHRLERIRQLAGLEQEAA